MQVLQNVHDKINRTRPRDDGVLLQRGRLGYPIRRQLSEDFVGQVRGAQLPFTGLLPAILPRQGPTRTRASRSHPDSPPLTS
ncbi:hypothetical protein E2C01_050910 [Portunus trituberculatus]|uniref:Uncharacterized protein n=1 Tax=Portunus trituberculatus TaxID=210409 RepID=A0A5B7GDC6_PORTR|nr:hypothetical protein [Portunus trituberculatus]